MRPLPRSSTSGGFLPPEDVLARVLEDVALLKQALLAPPPGGVLHDWLSLDEVATRIGRSRRYVQEQIATGSLISVEAGKVSRRHYDAWLEARDQDAEDRRGQPPKNPQPKRPKRRSGRR